MKIALVGEAWGEVEEQYRSPFVGSSGQELTRMLNDAGINRGEVFLTNVFNFRPVGNDIASLLTSRDESGDFHKWPALLPGKYLQPKYTEEINRLRTELTNLQPNIVIACGNTACWALLRSTAISKIRGAIAESTLVPGLKVLPTYHPEKVLRQYELRPVAVMDFIKARNESAFPEIRRPIREIWLDPTLNDIAVFTNRYCVGSPRLAFDIETSMGQMTCIGFAPSMDRSIVIPFFDARKPGNNYWPTLDEELSALDLVQILLRLPVPKVGQNILYDIQYLWMKYGMDVNRLEDDTMLLHHSLHPESPKALDFLGSVYTNEVAWKTLRPRGGKRTIKRED